MSAISFYNDNINPLIVEYQKKVFDHFNLPLIQFKYNVDHSHGYAIDWWLRNEWPKTPMQNIIIFDIDCIPLHAKVISHAQFMAMRGYLHGAAQRANHIPGSPIYCSPAFCAFRHREYLIAGMPSFCERHLYDVGGYFTSEMSNFLSLSLIKPTHVEHPMWDLSENIKFGYGTTYDESVYHAFESRFNHSSSSRFIQKCKEVIGE